MKKKRNLLNIINWEKIFMHFFGAFNPVWDTEFLKKEESFWLRYAILVKKTWLRLVPTIWTIMGLIIIAIINMYFLNKQFNGWILGYVLIWLYIFNIIYTIAVFFYYLFWFIKINKKVPKIRSIYTWIQRSEYSDNLFHNFFNQIIFNIVFFLILTIVSSVYLFINTDNLWSGIINIILFMIQIYQLFKIKNDVNNQEMDFVLMTPTNFYMYNMDGYSNIIDHDFPVRKIRNVKKTYWETEEDKSLIGSIFKFWTIIFLLDGWDWNPPKFRYTPHVVETTNQFSLFIKEISDDNPEKQYTQIIKNLKVILPKILYDLDINITDELKNVIENDKYHEEIKNYLLDPKNKAWLQKEYLNWNKHIKKEIIELWKKYLN